MEPQKVRFLDLLDGFDDSIPDRLYVSHDDFERLKIGPLEKFLPKYKDRRIISRSVHKLEDELKAGTCRSKSDWLDTIDDALRVRDEIIQNLRYGRSLSIQRQQKFNALTPDFNPDHIGILYMPVIEAWNIMAKFLDGEWEFGISRVRDPDIANKIYQPRLITKKTLDDEVSFGSKYWPQIFRAIRPLTEHCDRLRKYLINKTGNEHYELELLFDPENRTVSTVQVRDISRFIDQAPYQEEQFDLTCPSYKADRVVWFREPQEYRKRVIYLIDEREIYGPKYGATQDEHFEFLLKIQEEFKKFALEHEKFGVVALHPRESRSSCNHLLDFDKPPELMYQYNDDKITSDHFGELYYPLVEESDLLICPTTIGYGADPHGKFGIENFNSPLLTLTFSGREDFIIFNMAQNTGLKTGSSIGTQVKGEKGKFYFLKDNPAPDK